MIDRPNQVWATDVTYIPMARGFVYLVAIIDWYSRKVLSWRLSSSMTADFGVEGLEEPIASSRSCRKIGSRSAWMDAARNHLCRLKTDALDRLD